MVFFFAIYALFFTKSSDCMLFYSKRQTRFFLRILIDTLLSGFATETQDGLGMLWRLSVLRCSTLKRWMILFDKTEHEAKSSKSKTSIFFADLWKKKKTTFVETGISMFDKPPAKTFNFHPAINKSFSLPPTAFFVLSLLSQKVLQ